MLLIFNKGIPQLKPGWLNVSHTFLLPCQHAQDFLQLMVSAQAANTDKESETPDTGTSSEAGIWNKKG